MRVVLPALLLPLAGLSQSTWRARATTVRPPARHSLAMAFDATRGVTVIHGGHGASGPLGDTWTWNGTDWVQQAPLHSPGAREGAAMVYDNVRRTIVLFGGWNQDELADTWEWDGTDWTQRFAAHTPDVRCSHAMAFDSRRGVAVLFGGYGDGPWKGDTWEWDGADWTRRTPATSSPAPRWFAAMAFDAARERSVLCGGWILFGTLMPDTFLWDGSDWTRITTTVPTARLGMGMAYDSARAETVQFGGATATGLVAETWEWNGTEWRQDAPANSPPPLQGHAMAYDPVRQVTVLFGGLDAGGILHDELWEHAPDRSPRYVAFGQGCAGPSGIPTLDANGAVPRIGQVFTVVLGNLPPDHSAALWLGRSRTSAGPFPLPLDLTALGMPGCALLVSTEMFTPLFTRNGTATWTVMIPPDPALLGARFFNQALVAEAAANAFGAIVSNGGAGVIGAQ